MAKVENTKKIRIITSILCILAIVIGFVVGGFLFLYINKEESDIFVKGDLSIHFYGLGNHYSGDSIFIQCGDTDILIDAGSRKGSAEAISNYIEQYMKDDVLEYVIVTHSDQDHIAGFVGTNDVPGIFERYEVGTIIEFPKTNKSPDKTAILADYYDARDQEIQDGAEYYTALECYNNENGGKRVYQLADGIEMEILYNYYYENKATNENDYSVCLMINQGDYHYLFTGDLEEEGEKHLVEYYESIDEPLPECVLFKAGHHGSRTSSSQILMETIRPEYVVVCTCAGTSEFSDEDLNQFPSQQFIDNIAPYTDKVYIPTMVDYYVGTDGLTHETYQDMNGSIVFSVSSGIVKIECSNNDLILKETDWFKEHRNMPDAWK